MDGERYVLKHELEKAKGNIHRRINDVDSKHDEKHSDLKLLLHTFIEQQKPLSTTLTSIDGEVKKLNETMDSYGKRVTDIEYNYKDHNRRIKGIEDGQREKHGANIKIIVALIGAVATLGASAFGLAQLFF